MEHVYQLERSGETSTLITIGNEKSAFHGVSIKISELDSSKGQLNITIDNLRPETKALVEKHESLLLTALEKSGYQVHQLIATTAIETPGLAKVKKNLVDRMTGTKANRKNEIQISRKTMIKKKMHDDNCSL